MKYRKGEVATAANEKSIVTEAKTAAAGRTAKRKKSPDCSAENNAKSVDEHENNKVKQADNGKIINLKTVENTKKSADMSVKIRAKSTVKTAVPAATDIATDIATDLATVITTDKATDLPTADLTADAVASKACKNGEKLDEFAVAALEKTVENLFSQGLIYPNIGGKNCTAICKIRKKIRTEERKIEKSTNGNGRVKKTEPSRKLAQEPRPTMRAANKRTSGGVADDNGVHNGKSVRKAGAGTVAGGAHGRTQVGKSKGQLCGQKREQ